MEIGVSETAGLDALDGGLVLTEDIVVVLGGKGGVAEGLEGVGTVHTPGETELGVGEPIGLVVLEIGLFVDVPAQGEGREVTPLVVGTEAGGTVAADRRLDHVALVVVPVETAEVGGETIGGIDPAAGALLVRIVGVVGGVVDIRLAVPFLGEVAAHAVETVGGVLQGGLAEEDGYVVLAERLVPGQVVFELPDQAFLIIGVDVGGAGTVVTAEVEQGRVAAVAPEAHVDAEGAVELDGIPDLEFAGEGAHDLVAPVVVGREGQARDRIDHLVVGTAGDHVNAAVLVGQEGFSGQGDGIFSQGGIRRIDAQNRGHGEGGTERGTPLGVLGDTL